MKYVYELKSPEYGTVGFFSSKAKAIAEAWSSIADLIGSDNEVVPDAHEWVIYYEQRTINGGTEELYRIETHVVR